MTLRLAVISENFQTLQLYSQTVSNMDTEGKERSVRIREMSV